VAVVAVNFLGIAERLAAIRALLAARGGDIALIEDDAQWFPEPQAGAVRGDLVCTSFGRGKPVSLLGGGLLWADANHATLISQLPIAAAQVPGATFRLKACAINALLRPRLYGVINRNPLIELGQTRFKPLPELRALDPLRATLLSANVAVHLARSRETEREVSQRVAAADGLIDLPALAGERSGRLLRYPLLCRDRTQRDALWQALQQAGLGATAMYQRVLPEVEGVGTIEVAGTLPGARRFAERLLTLPVHAGVGARHLRRMAALLRSLR
jgi:dTDP-4-amino-4,6-dideoxygalactose transaminase